MKQYYDLRAPEYDDWYLGRGGFVGTRDEDAWKADLARLVEVIRGLAPARTLDVACGTGFLTRHLRGELTCLDQSARMLAIAAERVPHAQIVHADAIPLPFADKSFQRLFTGHFYGHLEERERLAFLGEARRVADELVFVDSSQAHSTVAVEWQPRFLDDGSEWEVYKRFFTGEGLAKELGGGEVLHEGTWFVVVRAPA